MADVSRRDAILLTTGVCAAAIIGMPSNSDAAAPSVDKPVNHLDFTAAVEETLSLDKTKFADRLGAGDYVAVALVSADSGEQRFALLAITARGKFKISVICEGGKLGPSATKWIKTGAAEEDVLEITNNALGGGKYNKRLMVLVGS